MENETRLSWWTHDVSKRVLMCRHQGHNVNIGAELECVGSEEHLQRHHYASLGGWNVGGRDVKGADIVNHQKTVDKRLPGNYRQHTITRRLSTDDYQRTTVNMQSSEDCQQTIIKGTTSANIYRKTIIGEETFVNIQRRQIWEE